MRTTSVALFSVFCSFSASAATFFLDPVSQDSVAGEGQSNATLGYNQNVGGQTVGGSGSSANNERIQSNALLGFTLPTLPTGELIVSGSLTFTISSFREETPDLADLDTYLLNTGSPESEPVGDIYLAAASDPNPDNVFVGDTAESQVGDGDANGGGNETANEEITYTLNAATIAKLNSFYGGDDAPDQEAFFRFNLGDAPSAVGSLNRYNLSGSFDDIELRLVTAVPEPSSLVLSGLGLLALFRRKR